MKKTTFTLLLSLSCCWLAAQCPTGDITFSTQGQIDSFPINYPGCMEIPGNVTIYETATGNIANLNSLSQIDSIGGYLHVRNNAALISLNGLDNLTSIGGGLYLDSNGALMSLSALNNLTSIGGGLYLNANVVLTNLGGLNNLASVGGYLIVSANYDLTSLSGIDNLASVGGYLLVNNNNNLISLNGLGNLTSVGSYVAVNYNYNLTSLNGLDNLTSIGGYLLVNNNNNLTSLSGLGNIAPETISEMFIDYNPQLVLCNVQCVCNYLENGGPATIANNAPGCNSIAEVEAACMVSIDETSTGESAIQISPNPASDFLQIQVNDNEKWEISLFDLRGRLLFRQVVSGSQTIGLEDWPSGLYTLRAVSGERVFSGKFVKQ